MTVVMGRGAGGASVDRMGWQMLNFAFESAQLFTPNKSCVGVVFRWPKNTDLRPMRHHLVDATFTLL